MEWPYIWGMITGLIIAILKDVFVRLLPISDELRFRMIYNWKKFVKKLRNPSIKITYTLKTQNLEDKKISIEKFITQTRGKLSQNDFQFQGISGNSLIFNYILGKTDVEIILTPSFSKLEELKDEQELFISYVQADLKVQQCKYNQFEGHIIDLLTIIRKLENLLREYLGTWLGDSLSCEVSQLYKFTGVLSGLELTSLTGEIQKGYKLDLYEKNVVFYGAVDQSLISALKKIITFYY